MQYITPPDSHEKRASRSVGLDLIRCLAILFVIGAHFFIHTDFNKSIFNSPSMFVQGMISTLILTNVPLFLMLTGFLNINKKISRKYYRNGIRVIISYLIASVITILVRRYVFNETGTSLVQWILKITDFSAIPYAWYIEMWIGLFLLTPFLNILWNNIGSKKNKHVLLLTLYLLCALPDCFNRYGVHLVPGYWELIYPTAFFYLGAYIREYRPNINKLHLCCAILLCCLINPIFSIVIGRTNSTMLHLVGDGNGIIGMPLTVMVFLLCYNLKFNFSKNILASISRLSLDMYLLSYIFDCLVYKWCRQHLVTNQDEFGYYYLLIIATIFIASYVAAYVKTAICKLLRIPT